MREGPTSRRRLRFTLRVLFAVVMVLSVLAGWLAWNVRLVQQRKDIRQLSLECHRKIMRGETLSASPLYTYEMQRVDEALIHRLPALRTWLGDEVTTIITVENKSQAEHAKSLFPEATIYYFDATPYPE
jgi:hypothetical protein